MILSLKVSMHCQNPSQRKAISRCCSIRRAKPAAHQFLALADVVEHLLPHGEEAAVDAHRSSCTEPIAVTVPLASACTEWKLGCVPQQSLRSPLWPGSPRAVDPTTRRRARRNSWRETRPSSSGSAAPAAAAGQMLLCSPVSTKVMFQSSASWPCSSMRRPPSCQVKSLDMACCTSGSTHGSGRRGSRGTG